MFSLSLQQLLEHSVALLLIAAVHGWAISAAAVALGDNGPKYDGRRTLNPLAHLDVLGAAGVILFSLGWIRPVAIEPKELRSRIAPLLIAAAGIGSTLALALLLRLVMPLLFSLFSGSASIGASVFLTTAIDVALRFSLFNLLPIPPLTGGLLWLSLVPAAWHRGRRYMLYAKLGLALLIVSGAAGLVMAPAFRWLSRLVVSF